MTKETKKYRVYVVRIGYSFKEFEIASTSKQKAKEAALEIAGGFEFSEKSADYKVDCVEEIKT